MRLINTRTLALREFYGSPGAEMPHYAILSHTWGDSEVSYRELAEGVSPARQKEQSYLKIKNFLSTARQLGYNWAWVDTCCIDKSSSAELSEAINSMFNWYAYSHVCLVYLSDVNQEDTFAERDETNMFRCASGSHSRWFTRGWTLQELLAPRTVYFYDSQWKYFGDKKSLQHSIATVSDIRAEALADSTGNWSNYSIAEKFGWAARRRTTRVEDEAYSLMGLFDVNMPLLYGEGSKAFIRLQQEIILQNNDQSIYTWRKGRDGNQRSGLLAPSASQFSRGPGATYEPSSETPDRDMAAREAYARTQDVFSKLYPNYVNHFQVAGHTLSIDQPTIGPVKSIFVSRSSNMFANAEIPSVTAVRFRSSKKAVEKNHPDPVARLSSLWSSWQEFNDIDVYIMPLLCTLDKDSLCVLLYRAKSSSSAEPFGRLHSPSVFLLHQDLVRLLTRPSESQHAYIYSNDTSSYKESTWRLDAESHPERPRYGYPRLTYPGTPMKTSTLEGYLKSSLYLGSDGTISKTPDGADSEAKQVWLYEYDLDPDRTSTGMGRRFEERLRRSAGSQTRSANFCIALSDNAVSIATFKIGSEPTIGRLRGLGLIPSSVFEPETNPFVDLPGLLETKQLDVWTFGLYEMPILTSCTLSLRSETTHDGHREVSVTMREPSSLY